MDFNHLSLGDLVRNLLAEKEAEELCRRQRIALEEAIALCIPGPDSGQKTIKLDDGTSVTVKRGWNYKAKLEDIDAIFLDGMIGDPPPIKTKTTRELDERGYEWFRENRPGIFSELSKHVTVTPKKIAVEVKLPKGTA